MGFTPLDGLVMATRSGSVDPGLVLWLAEHAGMPPAELAATLERRSGLLGLAGTADMREILGRAAAGAARRRGWRWTSTCTGSGARSPRWLPRSAGWTPSCSPAAWESGRRSSAPSRPTGSASWGWRSIRPATSPAPTTGRSGRMERAVRTLVVAAREDVEIAREVRAVLGPDGVRA